MSIDNQFSAQITAIINVINNNILNYYYKVKNNGVNIKYLQYKIKNEKKNISNNYRG